MSDFFFIELNHQTPYSLMLLENVTGASLLAKQA